MINTAQYNVAKVLERLLRPLIINPLECKDSFDFVNQILNYKASSNEEVMVSFDVVSLFTNVPLVETIDLCVQLWEQVTDKTGSPISGKALKSLLEFSTKDVPFIFNNQWYMQTDGVATGSPLAPLMASIFLQSLE